MSEAHGLRILLIEWNGTIVPENGIADGKVFENILNTPRESGTSVLELLDLPTGQ